MSGGIPQIWKLINSVHSADAVYRGLNKMWRHRGSRSSAVGTLGRLCRKVFFVGNRLSIPSFLFQAPSSYFRLVGLGQISSFLVVLTFYLSCIGMVGVFLSSPLANWTLFSHHRPQPYLFQLSWRQVLCLLLEVNLRQTALPFCILSLGGHCLNRGIEFRRLIPTEKFSYIKNDYIGECGWWQ